MSTVKSLRELYCELGPGAWLQLPLKVVTYDFCPVCRGWGSYELCTSEDSKGVDVSCHECRGTGRRHQLV